MSDNKVVQSYTAQRITFTSKLPASELISAFDKELRVDLFEGFENTVREAVIAKDHAAFDAAIASKIGPSRLMCVLRDCLPNHSSYGLTSVSLVSG